MNNKNTALSIVFLLLLNGCATMDPAAPPRVRNFEPVDRKKYKNQEVGQTAFRVAEAKCNAYSMQMASGVPLPSPPAQPSIPQIQLARPGVLPQPYVPNGVDSIAAAQAGYAIGQRQQLIESSMVGCMAQEGWLLKP